MRESSTYQALLEEGFAEGFAKGFAEGFLLGAIAEAKKLLRLVGEQAFGVPDTRTMAAIEGIDDLARLEELCARLATASSWQDLLGPPGR